MVLLVIAKVVTMVVPFTFKWATDALAAPQAADAGWWAAVLAAPLALTLAYGASRILMALVTQMRDGLFAKVSMHAVRRLALLTFEHMHKLSLRFHLERKTGGLTRVLERGRNAIETIVRMIILQLMPTILELALIVGILLWMFDWRYVVVILVTVAAYLAFTYYATEWRIAIRRDMNDSDTNANVKAIDSLLNFETVKYFSAETREKARYDVSMAKYEAASTKALTSLAVLNAGQAAIFTAGMTVAMVLCAIDITRGRNTVGDFVMINAMMIQLYQPLNFMGMVYREIKQAVTDIEAMFAILGRNPEIVDRAGAPDLKVAGGTIRFEDVTFAYDPARPILKGVSFEVPAGKSVAIVGPSGAGKSTISRLLFRFYDISGGRITVDGQDIREVTQASLRRAIGMVPQDTVLFNDTIRYNIRYGRWEAGDAEVEEAAKPRPDPRLHPAQPGRLRDRGRRARPQALRRREAARRHRPRHPEVAADPRARRGDLGARQPHGARDPGGARPHRPRPHRHRHRPSPVDRGQCRRDHRPRRRQGGRARHAWGTACQGRPLCRIVEPSARGGGGRGEDRRPRPRHPGQAAGVCPGFARRSC
jgi:ABC-type transport system involved in Fe-S cluster assembly fused permease/ATPase subunit